MNIAIAADHGGYALKEQIRSWLAGNGYAVTDFGCESADSVDYPDYAQTVARQIAGGKFDLGILVCGTGIGMSIAANKVAGVRAALCNDIYCAEHARKHNDANIMAIGGRVVAPETAIEIVKTFVTGQFEGGRHQRRLDKIAQVEREWGNH
jgi:ribose 5-phosphate isomerase B